MPLIASSAINRRKKAEQIKQAEQIKSFQRILQGLRWKVDSR